MSKIKIRYRITKPIQCFKVRLYDPPAPSISILLPADGFRSDKNLTVNFTSKKQFSLLWIDQA